MKELLECCVMVKKDFFFDDIYRQFSAKLDFY